MAMVAEGADGIVCPLLFSWLVQEVETGRCGFHGFLSAGCGMEIFFDRLSGR